MGNIYKSATVKFHDNFVEVVKYENFRAVANLRLDYKVWAEKVRAFRNQGYQIGYAGVF